MFAGAVAAMRRSARGARQGGQGGFALPAVLFAMLLIALLGAVALTTSIDERSASHAMRESASAFYAAEAGANAVLAAWGTASYDTLLVSPGDSAELATDTLENGATYTAKLRRIDDGVGKTLYTIQVRAKTRAGATSALTVVAGREASGMTFPAALMAPNTLRKNSPNGLLSGVDLCGGDTVAGVQVPTGGYQGVLSVLEGDPPLDEVADPVAALQSALDWPGTLAGAFDYTIVDESGWPDFSQIPAGTYPSILATGSRVRVRDDHSGRGLLVIEHELWINNDWQWSGLVLVGDYMKSNGKMTIRGAAVTGANMALGQSPGKSTIGPGVAQILYDSCEIGAAMGNPSRVKPIFWLGVR